MGRNIADINLSESAGYCALVAKGFDSFKETLDLPYPEHFIQRMTRAKEHAELLATNRKKEKYSIVFGGQEFQLWCSSTQSARWVIENERMRIFFRPWSKTVGWAISIEYSSAGLWGNGLDSLRFEAIRVLKAELGLGDEYFHQDEEKWRRITMFHYAFDFHSPQLSDEITPLYWERIIAPSRVSKNITGSGKVETITIGSKNNLQVQLYNKGKEISKKKDKLWMFDVWQEQTGYVAPANGKERNVWRLELRFFKAFLKQRGIRTAQDVFDAMPELLGEAISTRRLTVPSNTDNNRWRWALHPIWSEAFRQSGEAMMMLERGNFSDLSGTQLNRILMMNVIGGLRALGALRKDEGMPDEWPEYIAELQATALDDEGYSLKLDRVRERYKNKQFICEENPDLPTYDHAYDYHGRRLISTPAQFHGMH